MIIAGHTMGTPDHDLAGALRLFRDAGLEAAEVIYQDDYPSGIPTAAPGATAEAARIADGEGVPIIGLTPYTTSINSLDDAEWHAGIDEFRYCIDAAHTLAATAIRVYAGSWHPGDTEHEAQWARLREALAFLGPEARAAGAVLCVENHFGTMTQTAADTAKLVREVDDAGVRVLYDQANLTFTHDEAWQDAFAVQGDLIGHVHVKDLVFKDPDAPFRAAGTARVEADERAVRSRVVGTGVLPWPEILRALIATGYDGALSLEYEYRWHPQDLPEPAVGFAQSVINLNKILKEANA
ncbi:sugar phosphate isomerase/epimerase family protein [Actinomyces qiguomingii]|uniref:sugar phosphate isomerase/epimerase family protein n=1 Tax=Actinomyces qiguomingii TaxID=2057800 RepID=UPI000CA019A0|nr:sugar phosphate isomerase/epimerase family protein [Actinomyces qiguomingii]